MEGAGTAGVLVGAWAWSPARPTPLYPRHTCRGVSALVVTSGSGPPRRLLQPPDQGTGCIRRPIERNAVRVTRQPGRPGEEESAQCGGDGLPEPLRILVLPANPRVKTEHLPRPG